MCGRLYVLADMVRERVSEQLGFDFPLQTNLDLRPTDTVAVLSKQEGGLGQLSTRWGIKPAWSKQLLINAQAETVAQKKTFAEAFVARRCLVPCSGWFEWRDEGGARKQKYLFSHSEGQPLYMAGIYYPTLDNLSELVTLTIAANDVCAQYHQRMPLLIKPENISYWFASRVEELQPLLVPLENSYLSIEKCGEKVW